MRADVRCVGVDVSDLEVPGLEVLSRDGCGCVSAGDLQMLLTSLDPAELATDYEVLDLVAAWDRLGSWVAAQQLAAIAGK